MGWFLRGQNLLKIFFINSCTNDYLKVIRTNDNQDCCLEWTALVGMNDFSVNYAGRCKIFIIYCSLKIWWFFFLLGPGFTALIHSWHWYFLVYAPVIHILPILLWLCAGKVKYINFKSGVVFKIALYSASLIKMKKKNMYPSCCVYIVFTPTELINHKNRPGKQMEPVWSVTTGCCHLLVSNTCSLPADALWAAAAFCLTKPATANLKKRSCHEWKTEGQREESVKGRQL